MTSAEKDVIRKLPKVDLHLHLDGAARPETIMHFMRKSGARLPTEDPVAFRTYVQAPRGCRSLADFLKAFEFFYPFLKSSEAMERIAYELCEDCSKQNVRYFEARFAPALQAGDGLSQEDVVRAVLRGLEKGSADFSVGAGAILCCYRSLTEEENRETVRVAEKFLNEGVVGLDLAGDEARYPVKLYAPFFRMAAERKIPITCHAGEAAGPESVRQALELGARRIGHGVRIKDDDALRKRLRDERVPLEMCVTSNVHTQAVKGYAAHPARRFLAEGLRVTLNTDDPGVSGIDLVHEYETAIDQLGFSWPELSAVILNGVESLFLPEQDIRRMRASVEIELKEALSALPDASSERRNS
jgi:adenosine deaminase